MKTTLLVVILLLLGQGLKAKKLCVDENKLAFGVVKKENPSKNRHLVGDKHLRHKAYGNFQIRLTCLADVNKFIGKKKMRQIWGKNKLTMADMLDQRKSEWVFINYLSHWGKVYTKETGKIPTIEVYARIHNGGPNGWKKWNTRDYGKLVAQYANEYKTKREKKTSQKT